jgi:hypothetical protein
MNVNKLKLVLHKLNRGNNANAMQGDGCEKKFCKAERTTLRDDE